MKTSSCKAKGRRAAQEFREMLLAALPFLQPDDIIVTSSGETGPDLKLSPRAKTFIPTPIECKNVEKLNIWKALEQAEDHMEPEKLGAPKREIPILFFRRNRSKPYVALEAKFYVSFLVLISEYMAMKTMLSGGSNVQTDNNENLEIGLEPGKGMGH